MQCERGQHITVRKLDLLTWGVLLARVLVKRDVSREESMVSSCIFSGDSPRCSHRYREKIVSRDKDTGPKSILGNLLSVSAGIGHRRFEVLANYEVLPCLSLFPGIYCVYFLCWKSFRCSFKTRNSEVQFSAKCYSFVFNQIFAAYCLFPRAIELEY